MPAGAVRPCRCKLTEVSIELHVQASVRAGSLQQNVVRSSSSRFHRRKNNVPRSSQGTHAFERYVLVSHEPHYAAPGRTGNTVCSCSTSAAYANTARSASSVICG